MIIDTREPTLRELALREELRLLQESYHKAAQPIIDKLVAEHVRQLPKWVFWPDEIVSHPPQGEGAKHQHAFNPYTARCDCGAYAPDRSA